MSHSFFKILRQIIFYSLLIVLWQLLFSLRLWPRYLFPSPQQVLETLADGFRNKTFFIAIGISLKRLLIGYSISVFFGTILGLLIGKIKILDETVGGFIVGLQTLPSICWLPLAILWFGLNESAITFVVVMGSLLSITMATDSGVKNIQPIYLRAGLNMGRELNDMSQVIAVMIVIIAIGVFMDMLVFGSMEKRVRQIWGLERA